MSVIRDALRKEAEEGAAPSSPTPLTGERKEGKGGGPGRKKFWLISALAVVLAGGSIYYFSFSRLAPSKGRSLSGPQLSVPVPSSKIVPALSAEEGPIQAGPAFSAPARSRTVDALEPRLSTPKNQALSSTPAVRRPSFLVLRAGISSREGKTKIKAAETSPKKEAPIEPRPEKEVEELKVLHLFNEAVQAQQEKDFLRAVQSYREVLVHRPHHWETYNNLGLIYLEQRDYSSAREMFQRALNLHPRYLKAINNLGLLCLQEGKLEEAGRLFHKALDLEPGFLPALINLAVVAQRQGQTDQARKYLLRVLDYDSENPEACYHLGLLWEKEGAENQAVEYYRRFIVRARGPQQAIAEELKKRFPTLR